MKPILLIFFLLVTYTIANAQSSGKVAKDTAIRIRICAPSRSGIITKPMALIYTHNQTIRISIDVDSIDRINPKFIKLINVMKDSTATRIYGDAAQAGVVQIYLDDDKYPDAYKLFVKRIKQ